MIYLASKCIQLQNLFGQYMLLIFLIGRKEQIKQIYLNILM
jgi:hypothetical protein